MQLILVRSYNYFKIYSNNVPNLFFLIVPDAPSTIKALVVNKRTAIIVWSHPKSKNGYISKYTLYIQTQRGREVKRKMAPSQVLENSD